MGDISNSPIVAAFQERTKGSKALYDEANDLFPSGITHDSRRLRPYGPYIERGQGPRKWDVDGNEFVDYFGGHGALLLGHSDPEVTAAIHSALNDGTHFGASHPNELKWGQKVKELVPSAERIRFTSSGTEATHLALRLARSYTGHQQFIRFKTHFHGWHDHMASGYSSHFDGSATPGVLESIARSQVLVQPGDEQGLIDALESNDDIAAIILEPTGSSFGLVPLDPAYLGFLREQATKYGVVLIFDEVVTGFRVAPGGAQAHYGVTPDLTTLAKILAGGLPGGAVVGRKEILDDLDFDASSASNREKIAHQGTYNANPVSAAAGTTALGIVGSSDACARANEFGERLRADLNELFVREKVAWSAYGTFSGFHIFTNVKNRPIDPENFDPSALEIDELKANPPDIVDKLRLAMLLNGVDITGWPGGTISATHGDLEREQTIAAFGESIKLLRAEGELG